jgi:hypothetical protein
MMAMTTARVTFNLPAFWSPSASAFDFGTEIAEERVVVHRSEPNLHRGRFHLVSAGLTTGPCGSGVPVRVLAEMGQILIQENLCITAIA